MSDSNLITEVTMQLKRQTPGALLYENVVETAGRAVTTIYLRKDGVRAPFPEEITLTITTDE